MLFRRILLMSTLAFSAVSHAATPMTDSARTIELDGTRAQALTVALDAFRKQVPEAKIEAYSVHVDAAEDGIVQVVFEPRLAPGETPALGGRTSAGRELNVRVRTVDYGVDGVSFAR